MSTTVSILGGVGLFLLGMTVMTAGLKAVAGPALRTALSKAAATPLRGAFWGAVVTLLVQSSSATTMTTIGLVSAGLLTFPQGLGLVFGASSRTIGMRPIISATASNNERDASGKSNAPSWEALAGSASQRATSASAALLSRPGRGSCVP
jgi:Na+/Pi-cotransporter